jgi:glycosyltransferase involved in cell wall biosynthesis
MIEAGVRTGADLAAYYAAADLFLFPSLTETFGNVTLEAMASGLAVVAFDYAAAHQHMQHGVTGYLVPYGADDAFIAAAKAAIQDLPKAREIGARARQAMLPYDWDTIYEQLMEIYYEAIL